MVSSFYQYCTISESCKFLQICKAPPGPTFFLDHFPRYPENAVGDKKPAEGETVAPALEDKLPFSLAKNS